MGCWLSSVGFTWVLVGHRIRQAPQIKTESQVTPVPLARWHPPTGHPSTEPCTDSCSGYTPASVTRTAEPSCTHHKCTGHGHGGARWVFARLAYASSMPPGPDLNQPESKIPNLNRCSLTQLSDGHHQPHWEVSISPPPGDTP